MYISDWIGDDYKGWSHEKIFITAPTGSGKTTFILKTFLQFCYITGKRILYMVNRNILKQQLESEVRSIYADNLSIQNHIQFATYQEIENDILNAARLGTQMSGYSPLTSLREFDCVICDEAHYFLSDSNFNPNTILSLSWLLDMYDAKLMIFMSATIDRLHDYIKHYEDINRSVYTEVYRLPLYRQSNMFNPFLNSRIGEDDVDKEGNVTKRRNYDIEASDNDDDITEKLDNRSSTYEYLDIGILNDEDDILRLVEDTSQKWLIFVNSIEQGNELKRRIDNRTKARKGRGSGLDDDSDETSLRPEVVVLTADYSDMEDPLLEVSGIAKKNRYEARILISTSVMDNGITLHDIELRNLIISADVETQFIQMLGRKRRDDQKVKLYLFRRDKSFFNRRLQNFKKLSNIARYYLKDLDEKVQLPWRQVTLTMSISAPIGQIISVFYLMYVSNLGRIISDSELNLMPIEQKVSFYSDMLYVIQSLITNGVVSNTEALGTRIDKIKKYSNEQKKNLWTEAYVTINRAREYLRFYKIEPVLSQELENAFDTILMIDDNVFSIQFPDEEAAVVGYSNIQEQNVILKHHVQILQDLFGHKIQFEDISSMFFAYLGRLYINPLSVRNLEYLCGYYEQVIEEYERRDNDKDSFVRRQLSWLGKSDEEIDDIIRKAEWSEADAYIDSIKKALNGDIVDDEGKPVKSILGKPLTKEQNIEFRDKYLRKDILKLLKLNERPEDPKYGIAYRAFYRTKTPISEESMDYLREYCNLPYTMTVDKKTGIYTIEEVKD